MSLVALFIGVGVATGAVGIGKTVQAGIDSKSANTMNKIATDLVSSSTRKLNIHREACGNALSNLGKEKICVLNSSMKSFLNTFQKIKNIDFKTSEGLEELNKMHIDQNTFVEMKSMVDFAASMAKGVLAGSAGGALVAFGAYSAAQSFAAASTGTAIAALHGAAATNATLAFFGGGSLAAGGLGMAGGTAVLGGLVAGPALLVVGFVASGAAHRQLEAAKTNNYEAEQFASQVEAACAACRAIRRRTYMFYNLLARLDSCFYPLIYQMEKIFTTEGDDYSKYTSESKKVIASCASFAVTVKSVLDTPLLTDEGLLTEESGEKAGSIQAFLDKMHINPIGA